MSDIIIFTAHQRGHYLNSLLAALNLDIKVLDVSELLGRREPQENMGPFGFINFQQISQNQKKWVLKNYKIYQQKQGRVIWSSKGVIEGLGAFTQLQLKSHESDAYFLKYILDSLHSNFDNPPTKDTFPKDLNELLLPFYVPLEYFGEDLSMRVKKTDNLKVISSGIERTVKFNGENFETNRIISFLSSAEHMHLAEQGFNGLLYDEALKPKQCWQSCLVKIDAPVSREQLPYHTVYVPSFKSPWVQGGLFILVKNENNTDFRLWFQNWYDLSEKNDVFLAIFETIKKYLRSYDMHMELVINPVEITHGTSAFPIYDNSELNLQKKWIESGVIYCGPDKWENLSLGAQIRHQQKVFGYISKEINGG